MGSTSGQVNLFSTGTAFAAQINLYNTGGTFAIQLKSPTLTSNIPFVLPSTAGSTGQFLTYTAGGDPTWTTNNPSNVLNHTSLPMSINFITSTTGTGAQVASAVFTNVGSLYFFGTTTEGTPSSIYAVIGGVVGVDVQARLFDNTNAVVIGVSAVVTTTATPQFVQLPITGSIATTAAYWEIQIAAASGTAQIFSISVFS